jgi:hypothetical protein
MPPGGIAFARASKRGSDERVPEDVRANGLDDPGAAGYPVEDPPSAVPVQPAAVRAYEDWSIAAFADGRVESPGRCAGRARW